MTWEEAIQKVLADVSPNSLSCTEIAECIISGRLRKNIGKTPAATVSSVITRSIRRDGEISPYRKGKKKGTYSMLLPAGSNSGTVPPTSTASQSKESAEPDSILYSLGMFWQRDAVDWKQKPKLLGVNMKRTKSTPVDFCEQRGIYLLYDGREIIYVGQTIDRPLGKRLYEHKKDRMSTR